MPGFVTAQIGRQHRKCLVLHIFAEVVFEVGVMATSTALLNERLNGYLERLNGDVLGIWPRR